MEIGVKDLPGQCSAGQVDIVKNPLRSSGQRAGRLTQTRHVGSVRALFPITGGAV